MAGILFIISAVLLIVSALLNRRANKMDEKFANRPTVIIDPSKDLFINQKYAIVRLLAFIHGASPISAFDEEANRIVQTTNFSLGISQSEVEKLLKHSISCNPDQEICRIIQSLDEIRDRDYLHNLYLKCLKVATISDDYDTIETTKDIFRELRVV